MYGAGPDLGIGGQGVRLAADREVQVLQVVVLRGRDAQQTRRLVRRRADRLLVLLQSIYATSSEPVRMRSGRMAGGAYWWR